MRWHSSSLRAPPPITCTTETSRPVARSSRSSTSRYLHASETRIARTSSPGEAVLTARSRDRPPAIRAGMSPGRKQALVIGVEQRHVALIARGGEPHELPVLVSSALALPLARRHSWTSHRPMTFAKKAGRAVDAALIAEVVSARQIRQDRSLELEAEQRPRARGQDRGLRALNRGARRTPRRCRAPPPGARATPVARAAVAAWARRTGRASRPARSDRSRTDAAAGAAVKRARAPSGRCEHRAARSSMRPSPRLRALRQPERDAVGDQRDPSPPTRAPTAIPLRAAERRC